MNRALFNLGVGQQVPSNQSFISPRQRNRLLQVVISIALLLAVLHILRGQQQLSHYSIAEQAREMTRTLVDQAASTAARLVMEQDESGLAIMATRLTQHQAIHDVALYNEAGQLLATSASYQPLKERMASFLTLQPEDRLEARVATIYHEGDAIGFIQFTVSYQALVASTQRLEKQSQERTRLALLFTLFAGILLANSVNPSIRAASRFKRKHLKGEIQLEKPSSKDSSSV